MRFPGDQLERALFIAFIACCTAHALGPSTANGIAWIKPFVNNTSDSNYNSMTMDLMQKLKDDTLVKRASIVPVVSDSEQFFFVKISGTIGTVNNKTIFTSEFCNSEGKRLWEVVFDLDTVDRDDALEMVQKKVVFYLEKSLVSKLIVSSNPSGCALIVNGTSAGTTPLEVQLTSGLHRIELHKRYFTTMYDTIRVQPAEAFDVHKELKYEGMPMGRSILISSIITLGTFIVAEAENSAHQSYRAVAKNSPQSEFDTRFNEWRTLNIVRNTLFSLTGISWTISGILWYKNKETMKKAYSF